MDELEVLRVRDEVLQALYWMSSEGLADQPPARELARFLAVPADRLEPYLERFAQEGWLSGDAAGGYRLTARGVEEGKRSFADEFADVTRPTHGECDEDCWCHQSPEAAASCLEERRGHVHAH